MTINSVYFARKLRSVRVRKKLKQVSGDSLRLSIFRSNRHIEVQLIDDSQGKTLLCVSTLQKWFSGSGSTVEAAEKLGKKFSELYQAIGSPDLYFDRGCYSYHGRVKSFVDSAISAGLILRKQKSSVNS
ncbi:50S ribosomal protein L18 [Candidatus Gromoviella agglomerans]|uniref:50S ribosomal protein L18 n=1 Tax=Candidatus Gromoviella agglomerans TaxID=2806609 RepID=UPI001E50A3A9|nr:50S ribosomal protein L18 [Candidatus Gromoviella agglomerans]UFX98575.1 50S ribosomal protein L18 [Candidatus Gromoviella agglomerans]